MQTHGVLLIVVGLGVHDGGIRTANVVWHSARHVAVNTIVKLIIVDTDQPPEKLNPSIIFTLILLHFNLELLV